MEIEGCIRLGVGVVQWHRQVAALDGQSAIYLVAWAPGNPLRPGGQGCSIGRDEKRDLEECAYPGHAMLSSIEYVLEILKYSISPMLKYPRVHPNPIITRGIHAAYRKAELLGKGIGEGIDGSV